MHKQDYKKILIDVRNDIINQKRLLNEETINVLQNSFIKQKEYLDSITFNFISSDNIYLNNLGNFIAYKLLKKKTNKNLIKISMPYFEEYDYIQKEINRLSIELEKISNALSFLDVVNSNEFEKYMSYKID